MTYTKINTSELPPWLLPVQQQLRATRAGGRLPHALLIQAAPGLGAELLGQWLAALVLCSEPEGPCGRCANCSLLAAGNHPDFNWVTRIEDAKQLQVDQIRSLCDALALKSYRGGYKVAVITPADLMTPSAANALLKTLEEPPAQSLLVLCAARASRLPATIVSRCQRVKIARPERESALDWLEAQRPAQEWVDILDHAAGAPLRALELVSNGFEELNSDMTTVLGRLKDRSLDIPGSAERWAKQDLAARLDWLEVWITRTVQLALGSADDLPSGRGIRNIRGLYELLDRVRGMKLELSTSLNMQLATEELLLNAERALAA